MPEQALLPGVMVEDCLVLGWHRQDDTLVLEIEASLWPGHAAYERPKPDEWTCYKHARSIFENVTAIDGLVAPCGPRRHIGDNASEGFGTIDVLKPVPGGYRIAGQFGDVVVLAGSIRLDVDEDG